MMEYWNIEKTVCFVHHSIIPFFLASLIYVFSVTSGARNFWEGEFHGKC